jgi:uncharacterized protein YjiK
MMHRQSLGDPCSFAFLCLIFVSTLFFFSCDSRISFPNPPGYDFSKPYVYRLPTALDEISGVVYYPKDNSVFAIQDEKGWLFKIYLESPLRIERWKFSNSGDYEDVSLVDSQFFVLKSKGVIEKFKFFSGDSLTFQSFKLPEEARNEFETLFYDSSLRKLVLVCKNCEHDKKNEVSSRAFDPNTDSFSSSFTISTSKVREQLDEEKIKFKPSAAAIDPLTGELYILASVNKALVILNKDHSVKNCYKINPALFKQPEGITFTPRGDLIISNEAADKNAADILFFQYHKPQRP